MIIIFYIFAAVLVFLSYKSLRGGINYLNFFKSEIAKTKSDFTAFVSIIAPCRGVDEDLEENLAALFRQDFPLYEVIFVIDSETDEAVKIIEKVSREDAMNVETKLVIAGKATDSAQKVHNLREAVLQVSDESNIFVFVDSDARPATNWLRDLIAPLRDEKIGCTTGYRWFISKKIGFASELRSAWNASIASALGANLESNFCWGGSMGMRRETFEKLRIRQKWQGVLSDDFAVTRAMKAADLPIYFVPQALTASIENCSFRELFEFTTRQMKITRVYAQNLWIQAFIGAFLFNLVMIWTVLLLNFSTVNEFSFWFSLVTLFLVFAFSIGKSYLRLKAVRLILKDYESDLKKQFWTQNTLWIFSPALYFYNCFRALLSRKIVWRGISYQLDSPNRTSIIRAEK
ncbi:glycosyltransferase family 2 protein [soil metagenome]